MGCSLPPGRLLTPMVEPRSRALTAASWICHAGMGSAIEEPIVEPSGNPSLPGFNPQLVCPAPQHDQLLCRGTLQCVRLTGCLVRLDDEGVSGVNPGEGARLPAARRACVIAKVQGTPLRPYLRRWLSRVQSCSLGSPLTSPGISRRGAPFGTGEQESHEGKTSLPNQGEGVKRECPATTNAATRAAASDGPSATWT